MHTNLGDLNLELHCDLVPKTCENFLALCEGGYYTGTKFHRSIKNFMIQVGLDGGWMGCLWALGGSGAEHRCGNGAAFMYRERRLENYIQQMSLQGGDPTGTGKGGQSVFGAKFKVR